MTRKKFEGYVQKGKRLKPSLIHNFGDKIEERSYVNEVIPNIAWISLLMQKHGDINGINLAREFVNFVFKIYFKDGKNYLNFGLNYSFKKLSQLEKTKVSENIKSLENFESLISIFNLLNRVIDDCPFSFLSNGDAVPDSISDLKSAIAYIFDKYDKPSVLAQSVLLVCAIESGQLQITRELFPNFNDLSKDVGSDEFSRISGAIRTNALQASGPTLEEQEVEWAKDFWRSCYRLEGCILD